MNPSGVWRNVGDVHEETGETMAFDAWAEEGGYRFRAWRDQYGNVRFTKVNVVTGVEETVINLASYRAEKLANLFVTFKEAKGKTTSVPEWEYKNALRDEEHG